MIDKTTQSYTHMLKYIKEEKENLIFKKIFLIKVLSNLNDIDLLLQFTGIDCNKYKRLL